MKFFCLFLSFFLITICFADADVSAKWLTFSKEIKTMLVKQDQIMFHENEIFVSIDNNWLRVDRLESTPKGILAAFWHWTCPNCVVKNSLRDKKCQGCGWCAN